MFFLQMDQDNEEALLNFGDFDSQMSPLSRPSETSTRYMNNGANPNGDVADADDVAVGDNVRPPAGRGPNGAVRPAGFAGPAALAGPAGPAGLASLASLAGLAGPNADRGN